MSWLYVIRSPSGRRKVGYTRNLAQRLRKMEFSNSIEEIGEFVCEFSIACDDAQVKEIEAHAHALLWHRRVRGEWFWVDLDMARAAIAEAQAAAEAGHLQPRPAPLFYPGSWRGEGHYPEGPRTKEWQEAFRAACRERDRINHERRSAAAKIRYAKQRRPA